jgi:hypothetical protein
MATTAVPSGVPGGKLGTVSAAAIGAVRRPNVASSTTPVLGSLTLRW